MLAYYFETVMTLDQVAEAMGVSRQRIQQIERRALSKLRREALKRGITPGDLDGMRDRIPDRDVRS